MLKQIDKFYKYIMITIFVVYLINYAYFGELIITFSVIALAAILEITNQRYRIKQLPYAKLSVIGVLLLAGIAGMIYFSVLFHIFLNSFSLPSIVESILLLAFIIISLCGLLYFLKNIFIRAIEKH